MATMTAKFPGRCTKCGGSFQAGTQIDWRKGAGASHVRCGSSTVSSTAPAPRKPARRAPAAPKKAGVAEGEQLHRWCQERPDVAAEVGRVFVAGKRAGDLAGKVVVVVGAECGGRVSAEHAEDMGHYHGGGYPLTMWVRLATEAEAAPVLAAAAAKAERASLAQALEYARGDRTSDPMPDTAVTVRAQTEGKLVRDHLRVAVLDDATLLVERCGDPDMCDSWYAYRVRVTDAALVARVRALGGAL